MASVGALSARPHIGGSRLRRAGAQRAGKVGTVVRAEAYRPGINMPEGPVDDLNKWSRKITQPKSQGASQVRGFAVHVTFTFVSIVPIRSRFSVTPDATTGWRSDRKPNP
jgi:hypothetical protein|tara:strand:+ start:644 stop:973 length:330 start_codon:yes stop_codon:yes gene_type:complete